nr:MAG TPA: hypothetical protein [Caudoviricetes sp.]
MEVGLLYLLSKKPSMLHAQRAKSDLYIYQK